jgi:hypothetical protein
MKTIVYEIRRSLGLSATEFALLCECCLASLYFCENGQTSKIPKKIMAYLITLGFDEPDLQNNFTAFREELRREYE